MVELDESVTVSYAAANSDSDVVKLVVRATPVLEKSVTLTGEMTVMLLGFKNVPIVPFSVVSIVVTAP